MYLLSTGLNEVNNRRLEVCPCRKCGSVEINMFICNYIDLNIGGGRCEACGTYGIDNLSNEKKDEKYLTEIWNRKNNAKLIISDNLKLIEKLRNEIEYLEKFN